MSGGLGKNVCVIGAGSSGLAVVKNLVEVGFEVTCLERNDYIGGLWHYTDDPTQTSALPGTVTNFSKLSMAYSDFQFPEEMSLYPTCKEMEAYFEAYAAAFDLNRHIRLNAAVVSIDRDEARQKWQVNWKCRTSPGSAQETDEFDRLLICTGLHTVPSWPMLTNRERFGGEILHSQQFKDASRFARKNVLVLGISATAADIIGFLRQKGVGKVYVSHRKGLRVVSRLTKGRPLDTLLTKRFENTGALIRAISPRFSIWMMDRMLRSMQNEEFPALKDHPACGPSRPFSSLEVSVPCVSDDLANGLASGDVESVHAVAEITGPRSVRLVDGTILADLDAIICATGNNFAVSSLLPASSDPHNPALAPDNFAALRAAKYHNPADPHPRLYRNLLSLVHPHALGFVGYGIYRGSLTAIADLSSMAIAQLWSDNYPMPSAQSMRQQADARYAYLVHWSRKQKISFTGFEQDPAHVRWLNEVAGTGVYERLGGLSSWGSLEAWKLWWRDRKFYALLMDGLNTSHAMRLFDTGRAGGRKLWAGARKAIEKANDDSKVAGRRWQQEHDKENGSNALKGKQKSS